MKRIELLFDSIQIIELVNQLHDISKLEPIPLDEIPSYIERKLEEKQKIDEEIKEADSILQTKNVNIEAINEHIQLNERLNERGLSTEDIEKLLNLIDNAKEFGFDGKKIVAKLRKIKRLDKKEERLRNNCEILSKQLTTYKEILPLTELVHSMNISGHELISFKVAVNEAAEQYGFPRSTAAFYVINNIRDYNKQGQLKKELSALYLHKFAINEACSRQSQSLIALAKLKSYGLTEDRLLQLNNFLENMGMKPSN